MASKEPGGAGAMDGPVKKTREDRRREKDLEEARKAGNAAPEYDEEGNAINPHIPQFMAQAPWYLDTGRPSLKHQKNPIQRYDHSTSKLNEQVSRGIKIQGSNKYRKGACTNCGAMTHQASDCLERPRKKGAKWTNDGIAPDEVTIGKRGSDWDSKRDRWDGYDPATHRRVVEEHAALEAARQALREEQLDKGTDLKEVQKLAKAGKKKKKKQKDEDDFGSSDESDDGDDEDKYAEAADQAGQKMDAKTRITVRNLRIREDTAKYLMNLDVGSAHYDPKSRSMREAPNAEIDPEDATFAGENFTRGSGSVTDVQKLQLFAWQSEQRGHEVHVNAHPTQGELLHREFLKNKDKLKDTSKVSILDRYGGEEHLERVPRELLDGQTESYVEYSRSGKVVKGQERAIARSKYDEDVFPGNHKTVWGSWYDKTDGKWGFRCCHSTTKASYCTGEAGRLAIESGPASSSSAPANGSARTLLEQMQERINAKAAEEAARMKGSARKRREASADVVVEEDDLDLREERERQRESASRLRKDRDDPRGVGQLDQSKVEEARRMEKRRRVMDDDELAKAGRDKYGVTEEEVEAYRREREMGEDPMARFQGDELLPL